MGRAKKTTFLPRKRHKIWQGASPAVCTLPMVPCGSSPVARLYLAKNEAPEEEAVVGAFEFTVLQKNLKE